MQNREKYHNLITYVTSQRDSQITAIAGSDPDYIGKGQKQGGGAGGRSRGEEQEGGAGGRSRGEEQGGRSRGKEQGEGAEGRGRGEEQGGIRGRSRGGGAGWEEKGRPGAEERSRVGGVGWEEQGRGTGAKWVKNENVRD